VRKRQSFRKRQNKKQRIYSVLAEAKYPLPPEKVFRLAGFRVAEQPESVLAFYHALSPLIAGGAVQEDRPDDHTVLLRAVALPEEQLQKLLQATETNE
jgi:hypothetical protein